MGDRILKQPTWGGGETVFACNCRSQKLYLGVSKLALVNALERHCDCMLQSCSFLITPFECPHQQVMAHLTRYMNTCIEVTQINASQAHISRLE